METENNSKKVLVVGILAFLIGFGIGFLVFGNDAEVADTGVVNDTEVVINGEGASPETSDTAMAEPIVVNGVSLTVSDQNFGTPVSVDSVVLDRTSWVVVYEDNAGVPGSILGAHVYDKGTVTDAQITLLRSTVPELIYYVKIHADDGDRAFDFKKDLAVVDESGQELVDTVMTVGGTPRWIYILN